MDIRKIAEASITVLKAKWTKKCIPLAVQWSITNRCNSRCQYCRLWSNSLGELTTKQIFKLIDDLKKAGTRWITFTGGEPLLRDDIGQIVKYTSNININTTIYSNGLLISKKIDSLKGLKTLRLSLDGPEEINDSIRGEGAYKGVIEAIKVVRANKIKILLCTTLTKYNLEFIDFIINQAKALNIPVAFQPAFERLLGTNEPNPLSPNQEEYRQAIKKIISAKIKNKVSIYNSITGLKYLYDYPNLKKSRCGAGLIFCQIESNGDLRPCPKIERRINLIDANLTEALRSLGAYSRDFCYSPCGCVRITECNLLFNLNFASIFSLLNAEF